MNTHVRRELEVEGVCGGVRVSFVVCARSSEHEGGSVNNNNYVDEREDRRENLLIV